MLHPWPKFQITCSGILMIFQKKNEYIDSYQRVFLPCGEHQRSVIIQPTGFPPSQQVLFSNKNIKIKHCKAKYSGKKDFIFSQIVVNQLYP